MPEERIWFDTDPGIDDAVALVLAASEAGPAVEGFSSVAGNVGEAQAAANVLRVTRAIEEALPGALGSPRLARGADRPLLRPARHATHVHGEDGLGGRLPPLPVDLLPKRDVLPAYRALVELAPPGERFEGTLVALGPLTNVALACLCDRDWPRRVRRLVVMGGSIEAGGNATAAAEFNFFADPEAARIVLEAGFPQLDLVPIDAGRRLAFTRSQWSRLEGIATPVARLVRELTGFWRDRVEAAGMVVYDAIAWMAVHHADLFDWRAYHVTVDTAGGAADGASVADRTHRPRPSNCRVAVDARAEPFWEHFFALLKCGGGAGTASPDS
ncbi:MAG: nucleoside hydrolase [Sphaerobacter sp.]|nr:nucleoside hydrolase [Sphaerobacter sp.]